MRLTFDPALDHGGWPGPLGAREAVDGERWVGPRGLLEVLETALGLGGQHATSVERACELVGRLRDRDGWWRASFEADPLGTARRLLRDRDALMLWGWRGEPAGPRLVGLWEATAGVAAGLPDRLRAVHDALDRRAVDVERVASFTPVASLEPGWAGLLRRLATRGVDVVEAALPDAAARGDLAAARDGAFAPVGDGTLTLLRPHGALAAADELAASLAALDALDDVLVVGGDATLDAALARHGLPRVGGGAVEPASSAIVRLVVEAAFEPMDPADLHALLALDPGPVPRRVARRLLDALCERPGRGAAPWAAALAAGLARVEDDQREEVTARVTTLLTPAAPRNGVIAAEELVRRLRVVSAWAGRRAAVSPQLRSTAHQAALAARLVGLMGDTAVSLVALRRLCDELHPIADGPVAQVGLAGVDAPGAVLGPARVIAWWGFTRASAPGARRLRLSQRERAQLEARGVAAPQPGLIMAAEASRWRRPLGQATDALVLVCPATADDGEPAFPHPLWDELRAAMPRGDLAARLHATSLAWPARAVRREVARRPRPAPLAAVDVGRPLSLRETESPSSLERLLGCSVQWTLHHVARLRAGMSDGPPRPGPLLSGILAHELLARVFADGALAPDDAFARAEALVAEQLDRLCETLALPQHQVERVEVATAVTASARALARLIADLAARVHGVEQPHAAALDGMEVAGVLDLVLAGPEVVIDLKWGKTSNRDRLVAGVALQLAIYAELVASTLGARPAVAYFVLRSRELLGDAASALPGGAIVGTVPVADTWRAARASLARRRAELAAGRLVAPGAEGAASAPDPTGDELAIAPPCQYCAYAALCGQKVGA